MVEVEEWRRIGFELGWLICFKGRGTCGYPGRERNLLDFQHRLWADVNDVTDVAGSTQQQALSS